MSRYPDKVKAVRLRKEGKTYREILSEIKVSKSTLSLWLRDVSITSVQKESIASSSAIARIEKTRAAKLLTKNVRLSEVYKKVSCDISSSKDVSFVAGFYLYWGEGTKTAPYTVSLTSSDPAIIRCFVFWLCGLGICREELRVKLHVYDDQNESLIKSFWSEVVGVSVNNFNKSYRKKSKLIDKNYKGTFNHGTCVVSYHDRDMHEYVLQGVRYLRDKYRV